jgi:transcriptional regulator with XRE-family HTH domain
MCALVLTMDELARLIGLDDRQAIHKIESGVRDLQGDLDRVRALTEALGCSPAELAVRAVRESLPTRSSGCLSGFRSPWILG